MNSVATQQIALDNALVAPEKRLNIEKCNARIKFSKPKREATYQVTLDTLKLSPCYPSFLITAEICQILPNQEFVEPPSDEELVPFIQERGYNGKCDMLSTIHTYQMHQPWKTIAAVINRCISGKTTGLDRPRSSRAQILWGMFNQKNVDYVALLWEEFMFQADNRDISLTRKEHMPYPIFTKVPNEFQDKTNGTDEGTSTKLLVPDVPNYQSESENESWGDSSDDNNGDDSDHVNDDDDDGYAYLSIVLHHQCELDAYLSIVLQISRPKNYEKLAEEQPIQEQQQPIQELQIHELDDEYVEGEYHEFIDRNFHLMKELKISGLAKKAGVDDENFMINEVDLYMKDKWNSFTRDLQEFLEQQSDSKEIDYNEDQLLQIVNFIHITKDRYTTGMSKKVPNLGRSEQLNIATAYRDLRNSVKKMIG
ncbi:hypothetical protein Tco_1221665 [Tanacetum coccineum]